ncbi:MAG: tRNA (cytidine(56)-2'-O)-methyltransferase [Candidatus Bathyarchaeia archaeon]
MEERVIVLRMGHRFPRDLRITTHVCLTARAFGADGIIVSDVYDGELKKKVEDVVKRFGGTFFIEMGEPWLKVIKEWIRKGGKVIHLTMYGLPLPEVIGDIRASNSDKLIVVGAEKVPREIFSLANWNVSITNQPISEVSALGIFLDWYFEHKAFYKEFKNAKLRIVPSKLSKKVID